MIPIEEYMSFVHSWKIPTDNPIIDFDLGCKLDFKHTYRSWYDARENCQNRGMWPIVAMPWIKQLSGWLSGRSVLEVMAGAGWIAEGLRQCGNKVLATDNFSWKNRHCLMTKTFDVQEQSAIDAVKEHSDYDVLLVSWPYMNDEISEACDGWNKDIIYIGEGEGGCTASDRFFRHFKRHKENIPSFSFIQWPGIHDFIMIGKC